MDDSDAEYIDNLSSDDPLYEGEGGADGISQRTRNRTGGRSTRSSNEPRKADELKGANGGYSWEDEYHRSWDVFQEDESGSLAGVVAGILEDAKKQRLMKDSKPVQRGIIRNLILVLDLSFAMEEKDLRPNRYQMTLNYAIEFVTEFFDQNPISQLGIVGMRDGLAVLISEIDSNPHEHVTALQELKKREPKGAPSLQNALEMAKCMLYHVPPHCTKEVVVIFGALLSSDPGDIHKTIDSLIQEHIRVKVIGLAAQVAICRELAEKTNPGATPAYGVILNEVHFKDLLMATTTPLALSSLSSKTNSTLVEMGFPSRISETEPTMCSCHSKLTQGGYLCPRCKAKICTLPATCPCCNLTLILSTHLARSYHHLFPLKAFREVPASDPRATSTKSICFGCQSNFPPPNSNTGASHCFSCPKCDNLFCIDCDVFCHETLHTCPGCESGAKSSAAQPKIKLTVSS